MELATCDVCPRACRLAEGEFGFCGVRTAQHGSVEDKYRSAIAWPGIRIREGSDNVPWSYGGMLGKRIAEVYLPGCNLKCDFCIAPYLVRLSEMRGIQWVGAVDLVDDNVGAIDILGFGGGEASIHVEYVVDVFSHCRDHGIDTILETNGYMTKSTAEKLAEFTSHVGIGLKASLDPAYYKEQLGVVDPEPIRETARAFAKAGCEVVLTNLTDPNLWDDTQAFPALTKWIVHDLGHEIRFALGPLERGEIPAPWTDERIHVTPRYQRQSHLERYLKIANETGLNNAFIVPVSPRVGRQ
jgi:pyruvate formate lyase activating enzyme